LSTVQLPLGLDAACDVRGEAAGIALADLDTPSVLIDLDVLAANILRMQQLADRQQVRLRPHAKTHKSAAIANRQLAAGAVGVTCSSVSEAQSLRAAGISDITLAYPIVGRQKLRGLSLLVSSGPTTLVTDSDFVTGGYAEVAEQNGRPIDVLVEVDTGMHRVGVDPSAVVSAARFVAAHPALRFAGILTHAGHAHDTADRDGLAAVARAEGALMGALRSDLEAAGLPVGVVSAGSTLTAPFLSADDGITEIRPGTYVYNDLRTLACGACSSDSLAATMLTTVVSSRDRRVTIDAGNKTLTPTRDDRFGLGHPVAHPEVAFTRLSEEHGVLDWSDGSPVPEVGHRLEVLPIHICAWIDLQPEVYGVRGGEIVERIPVPGMRHSL